MPRDLPPSDELRAALAEAGVADAPAEGDEDDLRGLLWLASFLVEREKRVAFAPTSPSDPGFAARDSKVEVDVRYARFDGTTSDGLRDDLLGELPRLRGAVSLVGLDARRSGLKEYELEHLVYGEVTLSAWPHKPAESADPRIHAARDAGWTPTLKAHNLLPGRGIVVLDEHQGVLLREPALARLHGLLVLLATGEVHLWWNPLAQGLDPEMQHWLSWGPGRPPREWREVLYHEKDDA